MSLPTTPTSEAIVGKRVGERLAAARRQRGVTLAVVAGRCGLSPAYVSQIESGSANPTLRALTQLAGAVGVRVAALFDDADDLVGTPGAERDAAFEPQVSRAALAHSVAGSPGVWEHTAVGSSRLVARLVHGDAADHEAPSTHPGEEYVYVVRGSVRLHVADAAGGSVHELRAGDACHFPAGVEHRLADASPDLTLSVVMGGA